MFKANTMSNAEASLVYEQTFGKAGVSEDAVYYPGMCKTFGGGKEASDMALKKIGEKLLTKSPSISSTSGGTYTGYGLLPPFVDPSIVDRTVRQTPLVRLLPRRAVRGRSYVYNPLTAKAGAKFLGEDSSLTEQVDTRSTTNVAMKYLYAVGRITGQAIAAETIIDVMAEEVRTKTTSMNEALENEIINGDTTVDALGFNGLIAQLTTNAENNATAAITLELVRTDMNTAFEANGMTDLVVTDGYTLGVLKGLLMDYVRYEGLAKEYGIPDGFEFEGALFIKDRYMPTTATAREILYLDTRYVFLAVQQDYTYEELAKSNDSQKFMLKWYGALVVNFEAAMVRRYNLA